MQSAEGIELLAVGFHPKKYPLPPKQANPKATAKFQL